MNSLTKNTMYSFFNQAVLVLIPFITFPYISKVLGPEKYGLINYTLSIVSVFAVFAGVGLSGYFVREIAKCKGDLEKLGKTFQELFIIQLMFTVVTMFIYMMVIINVTEFKNHYMIFFTTGLTMLTNLFTFQWFFVGIEKFKYITTRDAVVKSIFVILVFIFVRNGNDDLLYIVLTIFSFAITAILNTVYLFKIIRIKKETIVLKVHLYPVCLAIMMTLISTVTIQLNSILLGSITTKENLGYYNVGLKVTTMLVTIVSNALIVILPRLSSLNTDNANKLQQDLIGKVVHFLGICSIPLFIGLLVYSKTIIVTLFGVQYSSSVLVSQITSASLVIMPLTSIAYYYVYSNNKERVAIYVMIIALVVNVIANMILTSKLLFVGAAIAFLLTELIKLVVYSRFLNRNGIELNVFSKNNIAYYVVALLTIVPPYLIFKPESLLSMVLLVLISSFLYFALLFIIKDRYLMLIVSLGKKLLLKK